MIVNLNIDLEYHKNKFNKLIKNAKKISGMKKHNRFVKLMKKDHDLFCKMIDNFAVNKGLNWYNPRGTVFYKEYADLKVHEVYPWKLNTAFFLDTKRWHSSSWWLSENDVPDVSVEWKRCIIGFGAYDIPNRNL